MKYRMTCVFLVICATIAAACANTDFPPASKVDSVRILGTRADKPYAIPGDTVTLDVLAIDGRKDQTRPMTVYWFPTPCIDPEFDGYYACYPSLQRAFPRGTDLTAQLQTGTSFSFPVPTDIIARHQGKRGDIAYGLANVFLMACAGHVETVVPPANAGVDALPFGCFDVNHQQLGADDYVFAYASIFAFTDRSNANPVIDHLTLGGRTVDKAAGIDIAHCTESTIDNCPTSPLDVVVPASSQEPDPGNTDPDGHVLQEQLWVDYYLSAGKVKDEVEILYDPRQGRLTNSGDDLYAPEAPGDYLLWAVVHDDRGGAAWLEVPLHVH